MKSIKNKKTEQRMRRHKRIRSQIKGTDVRPRISVFKSNTAVSLQLIDDMSGKTLAAATTKGGKGKNLIEKSHAAGVDLGKKALALKIDSAVFDRGGYIYTGAVRAVAEGAREAGLKF